MRSLGPGPRLCANLRPFLVVAGTSLPASFRTPTCRPNSLLFARSSSSLLRIASKR
jgi:hypothetical protein